MRAAVLILAALLAGCAGAPRVEIQRVNVSVPVECQEPVPARPVMPTDALRAGATVDDFTKAAQAEIERREGLRGRAAHGPGSVPRPPSTRAGRMPAPKRSTP